VIFGFFYFSKESKQTKREEKIDFNFFISKMSSPTPQPSKAFGFLDFVEENEVKFKDKKSKKKIFLNRYQL